MSSDYFVEGHSLFQILDSYWRFFKYFPKYDFNSLGKIFFIACHVYCICLLNCTVSWWLCAHTEFKVLK